ncbi:MAG: sugar transferase [Anaerolineae bacterium]|nr:sugar transferase [Anaerolineae bacterium]
MSVSSRTTETTIVQRPLRKPHRISPPSLGLCVSERRVLLAVFDVLLINLALLAVLVWHEGYALNLQSITSSLHYFAILTMVWAVWAMFFDCYDLPRTADLKGSLTSTGSAGLLTALVYLAIPHWTPHLPASRAAAMLFVLLVTTVVPLWRILYVTILTQPSFRRRILIIGAGQSGCEIAHLLAAGAEGRNRCAAFGYELVGFVDDDPDKVELKFSGIPVLGNRHDLLRLIQEEQINLLIVAIAHPPQIHPDLFRTLLECREQGVRIQPMTSVYEQVTGKVSVKHAGRDLSVVMPQENSVTQHLFSAVKRVIDLMSGLAGMAVLALVAPIVSIANALWAPGPLLYRQVRVGRGGKLFYIYKFRSMITTAEDGCGAVWARENDDRITPVGKMLRKTRLDELPQCWNVLKGDMSLVGPRPERPEFVQQLVEQVPFYQVRHAVRPGITGWAQVRYRYGSSVDDARIKLEYDLYYIRQQSIYLELTVLAKTIPVMLGLQGR